MAFSIAIVHEWLKTYGGSEQILARLLSLYPDASLYALIHDQKYLQKTPLAQIKVKTTFLQKIPNVERLYRGLLPIMPFAIESLDVGRYDVVISLSHAVAHGVKTSSNQLHVSYISTPMRYVWHLRDDYLRLHRLNPPILAFAARLMLSLLRRWDISACARSNYLLANSHWTAGNIRAAWNREAKVVYPPVDVKRFSPSSKRENFYLHVSRLVPYKMSAEIVQAFNELKLPLLVVGDGPEMPRLQKLAGETIQLSGYQPDEVVVDLMSRAKAFVFMAAEDFGIVMAEAQAAGCPVIAYEKGGAAEIVRDGETGVLFKEQSSAGMIEAVHRFQAMDLNSKAVHKNAARFSSERFDQEFHKFMESVVIKH